MLELCLHPSRRQTPWPWSCSIHHCSTNGTCIQDLSQTRAPSRALIIGAVPVLHPITRVLQGGKRSCQQATACPPPLPNGAHAPHHKAPTRERLVSPKKSKGFQRRHGFSTAQQPLRDRALQQKAFTLINIIWRGKKSTNQGRKKPIQTHTHFKQPMKNVPT